ncbi:MAG TPA: XRE family transcriptional regulator [Cyanobacteria bacterium UBA11372]|nr:XRE family transcriptional regulator [Cyanobacteria bacterium UBA11372]
MIFVRLDCVAAIAWNVELGSRLKSLRGQVSRASLSQKLAESGYQCSRQYIQKLETGDALSVSKDLLVGICNALAIDLGQLLPIVCVDFPQSFTTNN